MQFGRTPDDDASEVSDSVVLSCVLAFVRAWLRPRNVQGLFGKSQALTAPPSGLLAEAGCQPGEVLLK